MNVNEMYYGSSASLPEPVNLKAGPFSLIYENSWIRSLRINGCEVIRRIYMPVRDHNWNTIPFELNNLKIVHDENSFHISFEAHHQKADIDFIWNGVIDGSSNGTVLFTMDGEARSTFKRNRIGFCILHPLSYCNQPCTVKTPEGEIREGYFPFYVNPDQPFMDIRELRFPVAPGVVAAVRCEGDVFEMEDQRNWTDASFKTYCTPQSRPKPVLVEQGTRISQSIEVRLEGTLSRPEMCAPAEQTIHLTTEPATHPFPALGLSCDIEELLPPILERIQQLSLSHLRFTIDPGSENLAADLTAYASICNMAGCGAELAVVFSDAVKEEIELLVHGLRVSLIPVRRFLVFKKGVTVPPAEMIRAVKPYLKSYAPLSPVGSGTDYYFADLNRNRLPEETADLLSYSVNPQVHTFDHVSVMENLEGQFETLKSVHQFAPSVKTGISTLTLRPRKRHENPDKTGGADDRQKGLFCAAWTAGSLYYCIKGGADTLTYFQVNGPEGILDEHAGIVYPVYHIFGAVGDYSSNPVRLCISSDPARCVGFAMRLNNQFRWIITNLTNEKQHIMLGGLPHTVTKRVLDETTIETAMTDPDNFFHIPHKVSATEQGILKTDLLPYAVLIIDN